MEKLFMVYLGGSAPKANIELHDIQFAVAETIEDTFPQLKANWFGNATGLHMDSYKEIKGADGYKISLQNHPQRKNRKLYFINLGGYQRDRLNELHEFNLYVAESASDAKKRAMNCLMPEALNKHKDDILAVDNCIRISAIQGKHIHLTESTEKYTLTPDWFGYQPIN